MMKSLFAFLGLLLCSGAVQAQILGTPVVHWDFASGIPDGFTNEGLNDAIWEYRGPETTPDNTVCSQGSCGTGSEPIESLTADNGFLIFDSAWWDDNDGSCNGNGGPVEGPHDASLITASIDCSAYENLVLTWQQYVKHYQCTTTVDLSTDGGETWTQLHDNGGWYEISSLDQWVSINISEYAAGASDVRVRFRFEGDHYWWCIDDVVIYSPNDNDLMLISSQYTTYDFEQEPDGYGDIAYSIYPSVMTRPINLSCKAQNIGGLTQTGVGAHFVVTRNETIIIDNTDNVSNAAPGSVKTMSLNPFTPSVVGDYHISYEVYQNEEDESPENNLAEQSFALHPHQFAQDRGITEGQYLHTSTYQGAAFEMGNLFESWQAGLVIHSLGVALGDNSTVGETITGRVYDRDDPDVLLGESAPYTINAWDLNSLGDSKFVWLPLETPITTLDTTLYWGVVRHGGGPNPVNVAQSGIPEVEITILEYPDNNALFYMPTTPMVRLGIFEATETPGCTDPMADNYDATATIDDSTCRYPGCTFENSLNYDPNANFDDGSCQFIGCTDPEADNYNPDAVEDDGSCEYWGCTDPEADNYDPTANTDDGTCEYSGCTDPEANNYDPMATTDDGSCEYLGCTDPDADNYDPVANVDDGSCEYLGCTNPDADNYDPTANVDDGSCIVSGCTDPEADNYNPDANNEDGSCIYLGCTDPEADNYDPEATVDDGMCEYWGCIDPNALNYDEEANTDDGSCQYAEAFFALTDTFGCGELNLTLINQTVGTENGSCVFDFGDGTVVETCETEIDHSYAEEGAYTITYTFTISDVISEYSVEVNVYPPALVPEIVLNSETGELTCANCAGDETLEWEWNETLVGAGSPFSPEEDGDYTLFLTDTNGCTAVSEPIAVLFGCTDSAALNFNEAANISNPTCLYPEAAFTVDATSGCAPFTVTITNETEDIAGECHWDFDVAGEVTDCFDATSITYTDAGTYTVVLTYTVSGIVTTDEVTLTVYPEPITPELNFDDPTGILSCSNCVGDETATWTWNGTEIDQTELSWMPTESGDYVLTITDANGCTATSAELAIIVDNILESDLPSFVAFPNPATDHLTVQTGLAAGGIWMTDLQGRIVWTGALATGQSQQLNLQNLASGTYLLVWETAEFHQVRRVEVVR